MFPGRAAGQDQGKARRLPPFSHGVRCMALTLWPVVGLAKAYPHLGFRRRGLLSVNRELARVTKELAAIHAELDRPHGQWADDDDDGGDDETPGPSP